MQIANRLAGFSLGEADILRRAMGKKNREEMAAQREKFLAGCAAHKVPAKKAERIFDLMTEFAGYGFNKSHSCAYALLAYQTAWLKTHYPGGIHGRAADFGNRQHRKSGEVHPRSARHGHHRASARRQHQRRGLHARRRSRFASACAPSRTSAKTPSAAFSKRARRWAASIRIFQFCDSVDTRLLNRRVLESLIKAGAMDSFGARRAQLYAVIDRAMERAQKLQRERASGAARLFGAGGGSPEPPEPRASRCRGVAGARVAGQRIRHAGLLYFGASAGQACGAAQGTESCGAGRHGRPAQRGRRRRSPRMVIFHAPHALAQGRSLGHPQFAGHDRRHSKPWCFPKRSRGWKALLKSGAPLLLRGRVNVEDAGTRVAIQDGQPLDQRRPARLAVMRSARAIT